MQSGKQQYRPVRRLALTSAVAGAALLGCATPAVADQSATDVNPAQSEGMTSAENPKLEAAKHRLNKAEAALTKAQQDFDTAQEERTKAASDKARSARILDEKQTAYNQARNTPALTQARHNVETATAEHEQAKAAFDAAQQEVTRLENLEPGSSATITEPLRPVTRQKLLWTRLNTPQPASRWQRPRPTSSDLREPRRLLQA